MTGEILLGVITGAQGLKGGVRVRTFTQMPERIAAYGPLRTSDGRVLVIASIRSGKGSTVVVQFEGVENRSAAEALAGSELFLSRSALASTGEDEFYHADLVGLSVQNAEGRVIGSINAIHNFGAGDVIEILRIDGGTLLLPFTRDFVPQIDLVGKNVTVAEPEDSEADEQRGVE